MENALVAAPNRIFGITVPNIALYTLHELGDTNTCLYFRLVFMACLAFRL